MPAAASLVSALFTISHCAHLHPRAAPPRLLVPPAFTTGSLIFMDNSAAIRLGGQSVEIAGSLGGVSNGCYKTRQARALTY
jgi:hypothetical protein